MLRRAKLFVKYDTLQLLYNSLVQSYFDYWRIALLSGEIVVTPKGKTAKTPEQGSKSYYG